jgi:hypothetical protein
MFKVLTALFVVTATSPAFAIVSDEPMVSTPTIIEIPYGGNVDEIHSAEAVICPDKGCPVMGPIVYMAVNGEDGGCTEFDEGTLEPFEVATTYELKIEPFITQGPEGTSSGVRGSFSVTWS